MSGRFRESNFQTGSEGKKDQLWTAMIAVKRVL
jgi:hypothetical protein